MAPAMLLDLEKSSGRGSLAEIMQSDRYRFSNRGYAEENTGSILCFDARSDGCAGANPQTGMKKESGGT
jgi:hypothetical protein